MDTTDRQILTILQEEGDLSKAELARRVGLTPPTVLERLRKLREQGVLLRTAALLSSEALGLDCLAFILVQTDPKNTDGVAHALAEVAGVQEVHHVAGEDCLLVKTRCPSTQALSKLLRESFHALDAVRSTRSIIVLETVKESSAVDVELELQLVS